jgi:hypothetical protein
MHEVITDLVPREDIGRLPCGQASGAFSWPGQDVARLCDFRGLGECARQRAGAVAWFSVPQPRQVA